MSEAMTEEKWAALRADFPALERYRYLYSASGGPMPQPVFEKAIRYYERLRDFGDAVWEANLAERERIRERAARFINADPEEVEFIPSLSFGMNVLAHLLAGGRRTIAATLEFPSTTLPWLHQNRGGFRFIDPDEDGSVPPERYLQHSDSSGDTILTSHVQFSNGFRQDLVRLGQLKGNRHLIVNATQSLGAFRVDVREMGIDALACNSYKWLLAGYGCGILYVSRTLLDQVDAPFVGWFGVEDRDALRNDDFAFYESAARFNSGSPSFPTIFSLGAALDYLANIGIEHIENRVLELNSYLTERLATQGFEVLSPTDPPRCRSAQTLVRLERPQETVEELKRRGILCTEKPEGMRVATHFFNNHEDIDVLVGALSEITSV